MKQTTRFMFIHRLVLVCALAWTSDLSSHSALAQRATLSGSGTQTPMRLGRPRNAAGQSGCLSSAECNDSSPCTSDECVELECVHLPVPGCVPCELAYTCPPIELIFIMDTSGSMRDEAAVLCSQIFDLADELAGMGVSALISTLGITDLPGGPFDCLFDTVVGYYGSAVPGELLTCAFPNGSDPYECWGPATAIVAQNHPWTPGASRIIVPMSDEGPCNGSRPDGCNDPGDDRDSIENASAVALANGVIVSPVAGTSSDACVINLGTSIAKATGGQLYQVKNPKAELKDVLLSIILGTCVSDDHCDDREVCTQQDRCNGGRCEGTPIEGCQVCEEDSECDDENPCTTDSCAQGFCEWTPSHEPDECCDPQTGNLVTIDDENECTADLCDVETGEVRHEPVGEGTSCEDGLHCTIGDACDASGECVGQHISSTQCTSDQDCEVGQCDLGAGFCACDDRPSLCMSVVGASGALCLPGDEPLEVVVLMGESFEPIVAAQIFVKYDSASFELLGVLPGSDADPQSIFSQQNALEVDAQAGTILYAVSAASGTPGTTQPATVALLKLRPKDPCHTLEPMCFQSDSVKRTFLVTDEAVMIETAQCCSPAVALTEGPPALICPAPVSKNADAGRASAVLTWTGPSASSPCEGQVDVKCTGVNPLGMPIDTLAMTGGRFAIGVSSFTCSATDSCGGRSECAWNVHVRDLHTVTVEVELAAPVNPLLISRCIELEFYTDCFHPPVVVSQPAAFGGLFNFPGMARFSMKIPAGQYHCVTARDPLHTLKSWTSPQIVDDKYVVRYKGDPKLGGNWLVSGDLNGDGIIDILDQTLLLTQYQAVLPRNSSCSGDLHSDLNGDGVVDLNDLALIERSLYKDDFGACCSGNVASAGEPTTQVTVDDAGALADQLAVFDLHRDGVLDRRDIIAFVHRELRAFKNTARK